MSIQSMESRTVVPFVLIAFFWAMVFWSQPLAGVAAKTPASPDRETISGTAEQTDQPGAVERVDTKAAKAKPKRFPWLLVGAAVVVLAAAVVAYLLITKDEEGLLEDFDKSASSDWVLAPYSYWSVAGGYWVCDTHAAECSGTGAVYNQAWSTSTFTVNMKCILASNAAWGQIVLFRGTNLSSVQGYSFGVGVAGDIMVAKITGMNFITLTGGYEYFVLPSHFAAVNAGTGAVNELEVRRCGTTYDFYVNGQLANSFTDADYDPRYTGISLLNYGMAAQLRVDNYYVEVEENGAASLMRTPVGVFQEPQPTSGMLGK